MTPETVMDLGQQALWVTVLLGAPLLGAALVVGVLIGMLQAATQINEMTLSFVPKLGVLVLTLLVAGGWMLRTLVGYTERLITGIPGMLQ